MSYEKSGRTQQKARTRAALIAAARDLIARGTVEPTVDAAAEAASVSRTTAYRYFPSRQALLVAAQPEVARTSLVPTDFAGTTEDRLRLVAREFIAMIIETEAQQRTMLRLSLDPASTGDLPLRQGRAIGWFEEALAPLTPTVGSAGVRALAVAVRASTGIEALTWLVDVAGLSRDQAAEQLEWTAVALLRHAVASGPPDAPRR